ARRLRPPCTLERIKEAEARLGSMPDDLSGMLQRFNGGELFIDAIPFVTLFGLSLATDRPDFDWFIDRYTPTWRATMKRTDEWVIGMMNYGGVLVLGRDLAVREWDSAQHKWSPEGRPFAEWIDTILTEGVAY